MGIEASAFTRFYNFALLCTSGVENYHQSSRPPHRRLQHNSRTNQFVVSQVADWITRRLVNSPTANF